MYIACYTVILQTRQVLNQSTMSKYFKPVFDYKLSFDPSKGEKHSIKVIFTIAMNGASKIGDPIPEPGEGEEAVQVSHKVQTRTAKVRIC